MNIGIFVNTLAPLGASQRRMQSTLLSLLIQNADSRFRIFVLSYDNTPHDLPANATHLSLDTSDLTKRFCRQFWAFSRSLSYHRRNIPRKRTFKQWLQAISRAYREPSHYSLIRHHNIRLIYNFNQHTISSPVPFVKTIWDINHRIHSFFPEFSYTRYGFSRLDLGLMEDLARCSYVVTGTNAGASQLVEMLGVSHTKVRVIPFPAPSLPEPSNSLPPIPADFPFILYPARLWPHKNHSVILHALVYLKNHFNFDLNFVSVGADSGNLRYLKNLAVDLKISKRVFFMGEVEDSMLSMLYRDAFALVFASAVGPDNLPPLEAMAMGCPAIVAKNEGTNEQFSDSVLTFSPYDESDLARVIQLLATDQELRESLISKGYKVASQQAPLNYIKKVLSIFDEFYAVTRNWDRCDSVFI